MVKLSPAEPQALKKCSSERLKFRLYQAQMEDEKVLSMDRTPLLNAVAKLSKLCFKGAEATPA